MTTKAVTMAEIVMTEGAKTKIVQYKVPPVWLAVFGAFVIVVVLLVSKGKLARRVVVGRGGGAGGKRTDDDAVGGAPCAVCSKGVSGQERDGKKCSCGCGY